MGFLKLKIRFQRDKLVGVRGIPHLAKNERDVGHPRFWGREKGYGFLGSSGFAPGKISLSGWRCFSNTLALGSGLRGSIWSRMAVL